MDRYPPGVVLGICVGALCLATSVVTLVALGCRTHARARNSSSSSSSNASRHVLAKPTHDADEEEAIATHDAPVIPQHPTNIGSNDETQPLLSGSAIRTRYIDNANEFARPFVGQSSATCCQRNAGSLVQSAGVSFDPTENVVTVVQSDSSDSGIESTASLQSASELSGSESNDNDGGSSNSKPDSLAGCGDTPKDAKLRVETSEEETGYKSNWHLDKKCGDDELVTGEILPLHAADKAPGDSTEEKLDTPGVAHRDRSATTCTNGDARTKTRGESTAAATAFPSFASRPRSSTLNAQAKAFVPAPIAGAPSSRNRSREASVSGSQASADNDESTGVSNGDTCEGGSSSTLTASQHHAPDEPVVEEMPNMAVSSRRCKFWPSCSNKNCKYAHPSQMCRKQLDCVFGSACMFVHQSDISKINAVIARGNSRRSKRKNNELIRYNNLEAYVAQ
ncbi:hypothetical protein IWW48_001922 [Coemansia sp. RSA 1200]|nr:hypothetical protein IWW48_001922 [Coemansia sp. RSA 1200]